MNIMTKIMDWLFVRGFERDEVESVKSINSRQIRGNVLAQDGETIGKKELDSLAKRSNKAMKSLSRFEKQSA